jgi:hypothetical protein
MHKTKAAIAGILALFAVASAEAQQFPTVPDHTVIGRIGVGGQSGPSQAIPFASLAPQLEGVQSANKVKAGPASGAAALATYRSLVGADLPAPGASSLGGVQSLTCSASNWFNTLSTGGVLGCSQPSFADLTSQATLAQLPTIGANTALGSIAGGTPIALSKTQVTTLINAATSSLSGALPAFPNNTTTYFRGDGTYVTHNCAALTDSSVGCAAARGQLPGETTTGSATAGNVGEFISATVLQGSAVSLTTGTPANITSISLTAGDWDVWGSIAIVPSSTVTIYEGWISTTSAAVPTFPNNGAITLMQVAFSSATQQILPVGRERISISGTTTVFLSASMTFAGTVSGYGFIGARRLR